MDVVDLPKPSTTELALRAAKVPVHHLAIGDIEVADRGRRETFGDIEAFAANIKLVGLINPILVTRAGTSGKYRLVAGERRLRAHIINGETHIDSRIREDLPEALQIRLELDENIQRSDLSWSERCSLAERLDRVSREIFGTSGPGQVSDGWTIEKTAGELGISKAQASKSIKMARRLRERPDLVPKLTKLPFNQAVQELEKIDVVEAVNRNIAAGLLVKDEKFILGDAREELAKLANASISCIITDPPFGIPMIEEMEGDTFDGKMSYTATIKEEDNLGLDAAVQLQAMTLPELFRVLKPGGHLWLFFCYQAMGEITKLLSLAGFSFAWNVCTWYKGKTTAPFMGYRPAPCSEPILFCWKPRVDDPKGQKLNQPCKTLFQYPPDSRVGRTHPFQKPRALISELVELSTNRGDVVLDPFAGSFVIPKTALMLGRSAIGIEKNKEHWTLAQERGMML